MEAGYTSNQYYTGAVNFNQKDNQFTEQSLKPRHSTKKQSQNQNLSLKEVVPIVVSSSNSSKNGQQPQQSISSLPSGHRISIEENNANRGGILQHSNKEASNNKADDIDFKDLPDLEKSIRIGFVKKVYGILTLQLVITFGLVCLTFIPEVKSFIKNYFYIFYIAVGGAVIVLLLLVCGKKISRKVPLNYILLFLWTLFEAYMLMTACAYYDYETVLSAIGITVGLSAGISIYALFTRTNFSYLGSFLSGFVMLMLMMTMFGFVFNKWLRVVYCAIGVFVFSLYILYDTHLLLGKFREKYGIDDYIVAALNIYMDIVNLFLVILCLFGTFNRGS